MICRNQSVSDNQAWSCSHSNSSIAIHGSNTATALEASSADKEICLTIESSTRWNFADDSGKIMKLSSNSPTSHDVERICTKTPPYCGPPLQGVSSFVLSTIDILNGFRFPADLLYKVPI